MMEKQVERRTDVLSGQRENRIVKDFHNTIFKRHKLLAKKERKLHKSGKDPFLGVRERAQKGETLHRNFLA